MYLNLNARSHAEKQAGLDDSIGEMHKVIDDLLTESVYVLLMGAIINANRELRARYCVCRNNPDTWILGSEYLCRGSASASQGCH